MINILVGKTAVQVLMLVWLMTPVAAQTRQIVVSIPDHKLALIEDGKLTRVFLVATGRDETPGPTGTFEVVNRVTNPTYYYRSKKLNRDHRIWLERAGSDSTRGVTKSGGDGGGYGVTAQRRPVVAEVGRSSPLCKSRYVSHVYSHNDESKQLRVGSYQAPHPFIP